jgi:hypothetical protein
MRRRIAIGSIAAAAAIVVSLFAYREVAGDAAMVRRPVLLIFVLAVTMFVLGLALLYQPPEVIRGFEVSPIQPRNELQGSSEREL